MRMKHPLLQDKAQCPALPWVLGQHVLTQLCTQVPATAMQGAEGGRSIPGRLATFSSSWIIPSSKQIQAHSTVCSWAPLSVERKPISQKSCLQQPLNSVCFILTGHSSNTGVAFLFSSQSLFCSNAQHLRVAKIFGANQLGHLQVVLPIFQRRRAFAVLSALTTQQVYPDHFHCVFDAFYFICLILQSII